MACVLFFVHAFLLPNVAQAQETKVTLAGLAFSGDETSLNQRFLIRGRMKSGLRDRGIAPMHGFRRALQRHLRATCRSRRG